MKRISAYFAALIAIISMNSTAAASQTTKHEIATFGTGCFWCTEAVFKLVPGVIRSVSGYSGGRVQNPSYEQISGGQTGHAECIQVEFDPAVVSYEKLVVLFFEAHDPTTLNRQGADEGTQYRSVIFFHDDAQQRTAARGKITAQAHHADPIVTEIVPAVKFWPAEDYHQDYFAKHPDQAYCRFVIKPKVKKLQDHGIISK